MPFHRFNRPQRIVVVTALGISLYVLGSWMVTWGSHLPYGSATFTNLSSPIEVGGLHPWVKVAIWIIAVAIWSGFSITLLRTSSVERNSGGLP
jgi:branched-subunit amino acid ABC-type transport system permease component